MGVHSEQAHVIAWQVLSSCVCVTLPQAIMGPGGVLHDQPTIASLDDTCSQLDNSRLIPDMSWAVPCRAA